MPRATITRSHTYVTWKWDLCTKSFFPVFFNFANWIFKNSGGKGKHYFEIIKSWLLHCFLFALTLDMIINYLFTDPSGKQYALWSLNRRGFPRRTLVLFLSGPVNVSVKFCTSIKTKNLKFIIILLSNEKFLILDIAF